MLPKKNCLNPRKLVLLPLLKSFVNKRPDQYKKPSLFLFLFVSREERGSVVETAMMKVAPQRVTLTQSQTQIPTALINLWRRKKWKTRMRRKRRVKVRNQISSVRFYLQKDSSVSLFPVFITQQFLPLSSSLLMMKRKNKRKMLKRTRKRRRSPKMTLPDRGLSTGPALCSWGASPPPFPRLRLLLWVEWMC